MKNYIAYMIVFLGVVKVLAADWDFAVAELLPGENKRSYVGEITSPGKVVGFFRQEKPVS